jgi:hypothetical protein
VNPDWSGSQAILIGNSSYNDTGLVPLAAAASSIDAMAGLLTGSGCDWPAGRISRVMDAENPGDLEREITAAATGIRETLLVYYAGHGMRTDREFALGVKDTTKNVMARSRSSLALGTLAGIIRDCPARIKIIILDCCHPDCCHAPLGDDDLSQFRPAGPPNGDPPNGDPPGGGPPGGTPARGVFVIGASSYDGRAVVTPGGESTPLVRGLVAVAGAGLPAQGRGLSLRVIFDELRARLHGNGHPDLVCHEAGDGGNYLLVRRARTEAQAQAQAEAQAQAQAQPPGDIALSPGAQHAYRDMLREACREASPDLLDLLPVNWTLTELQRLSVEADRHGPSKAASLLEQLRRGLAAKQAFHALGGDALELWFLQFTYMCETEAWPKVSCYDALLVEAAGVDIARDSRNSAGALSVLAGFLTAVAAALGTAPEDCDAMRAWITETGHLWGDIRRHYRRLQVRDAWLVINLGGEPRPGEDPWTEAVTWTLYTHHADPLSGTVPCMATESGVREALGKVLRQVSGIRPLVVDLAVPRALMQRGIEHWPVVESGGKLVPLSKNCRPRLRWSMRSDSDLHDALAVRTRHASWSGDPSLWLRADSGGACVLSGGGPADRPDRLGLLLREDCGFIIWFPGEPSESAAGRIRDAAAVVPHAARRHKLPDFLPPAAEAYRPAVIWDDPDGREGFQIPRPVPPQGPELLSINT